MTRMRAIVDTSVLVRAVIRPTGPAGPVLTRLRRGDYTLLYAQPLLEELVDVLNRPRIRDKYGLADQDIETVIGLVLLRGETVEVGERVSACRDPRDDKFLEVAVAGDAQVIVTADQDLLDLHPFRGIPILSPGGFLKMLEAESG
jgi:putative PIN family toxin of toxin-antitoxin system